ncbi:MAG: FAD-dependent oxidoreductase [Myxococcales bacterium]|nr:FAD-dependent oxidoreductase [Myxococcales bacterium]
MTTVSPPTVGVIGGGMAGLTAARELALAGAKVIVFEADVEVGGRAHRHASCEFDYEGRVWRFELEHGLHGIWRQYRNLRRIIEEEGGLGRLVHAKDQEFVMPTRTGEVRAYEFGARVRHAPLPDLLAFGQIFTAGDFGLQALRDGPSGYARAGLDLLHAFAFTAPEDIHRYDDLSVAQYISRWPLLLQRMTAAITHSAFFREAREVSLAAYLTGLQAYFVSDKRDTAFDFFETDIAVDLWQPMLKRIRDHGGQIRTNTRVERVVRDDEGQPCAVLARQTGKKRAGRVPVDAVVLAVDPQACGKLSADSGGLIGEAAIPQGVPSIALRVFTSVAPAEDRAVTGVMHDLGTDNFFWLHRLQRPYFEWHLSTGGGILECHLYGDRATAALTESDETIGTQVAATVARAWPELAGNVVHVDVLRNKPTHVAFGPGVMSQLPPVAGPTARLALCGDWIACDFPALYLERSTITGLLAAQHIAGQLGLDGCPPAPLQPLPPAKDVARLRKVAKAMRSRGWLPPIANVSIK